MQKLLSGSVKELGDLLPKIEKLGPQLEQAGRLMLESWKASGKVLICGNGGSAADAMHLAEELCVRFMKTRRALAAIALCDPTVLTCAANDFGYEQVFSRQVEGLGNANDVLIVFSTSGNSANILRAVEVAKARKLKTIAFLGNEGGKLKGRCDVELLVPASLPHRIQEGHKLLYHTLCEWVEGEVTG